jgi:hypothetical protein
MDSDPELRARAVRQLRRKQGFAWHAGSYLAVNVLLWVIWLWVGLATGSWFPWPIFPTLGWGIGLFFHGLSIYGPSGFSEERIRREMRRIAGE